MDWKKILLAAGGAAAAAGLLYYLLREGDEALTDEGQDGDEKKRKKKVSEYTKEEVEEILKEIIVQQAEMEVHMKRITADLVKGDMGFQDVYDAVNAVTSENPLQKHGLDMMEFDQLLNNCSEDPKIAQLIHKIMKMPDEAPRPGGKTLNPEEIMKVYTHMKDNLQKTVNEFMALPNRKQYDGKTVTLVAQVCIDASVQKNLGYAKEDVERSIMLHQHSLMTMEGFSSTNMEMQKLMTRLADPR